MVAPGQQVSHYEILELLGEGGMGQVYLAHDSVLDRNVAIKVLSKEMEGDDSARQRFVREAKAAAALDHPFICKVYEVGEEDGESYIVMEYLEGETLSKRLRRGPLSLAEASQIGLEIAEALEAAHQHGIVHRDLKPANIVLTQHHAKVMDFGLAKQLEWGSEEDTAEETLVDEHLTKTGMIIGTLTYMSPEQAQGKQVDARSDIFSFGLVLQQMLTGEHPFKRDNALETVSAILHEPPSAARPEGSRPSSELSGILHKALAKKAADRYPDGEALAEDLRGFRKSVEGRRRWPLIAVVGAAAAAIILMAGAWWLGKQKAPPVAEAPQEPVSVLIADFENQTGEEIFDGALEQAVAIGLESAPFVSSYRRGKARQVAGDIREGADRLDPEMARLVAQREAINILVLGSISGVEGDYRIEVETVDGISGAPLATHENRVAGRERVLEAIGDLVVETRRSLGDTVPDSVEAVAKETFTTTSLEAARAYGEAQDLMTSGDWQEAIPVYRHAIQLDPEFGRAFAGLAVCHANLNQPEEAKKYYEEAFSRIDRMTDREKYRTHGGYYLMRRNYEKAAEEYESLVREYPSDPAGPSNLAFAYFFGRDMPKTLEIGRQAVESHPDNVLIRANLALYAMYASDFETAAHEAEIVLESNPSYETAYVPLAMALMDQGNYGGAAEVYDRLRQVSPWGASMAATGAADLALFQGRLAEAAELLAEGIASDKATEFSSEAARKLTMLAGLELKLGDEAGAVAATEEALSLSHRGNIVLPATTVLIQTGHSERALELAEGFAGRIEPEPQVSAKLIEGQVALGNGDLQEAIALIRSAQELIDTWIGRYLLGQAYLAAEAYAEAYSEFETSLKRRGEATSLFLDDVPSYHYFPPVQYYLGRAQEGLGSPAAADSYNTFLSIKEKSDGDPLVADTRRRLDAE